MDLFKIFYLIIYTYPFQNSQVISRGLLSGKKLVLCEPLHFLSLFIYTYRFSQ